jgi:hypothetical protein
MSGVPIGGLPAVQAAKSRGHDPEHDWNAAVEVPDLRDALLRAGISVEPPVVCALPKLRKCGTEANFCGQSSWSDGRVRGIAGNPGGALRALPEQLFFVASNAEEMEPGAANGFVTPEDAVRQSEVAEKWRLRLRLFNTRGTV